MQPTQISFELPTRDATYSLLHPGHMEWFNRLFGHDGDGACLPILSRLSRRPATNSEDDDQS